MKLILGIETSCDETSAALVAEGGQVISNVVASQIKKHAPYGGVVPELAAREHLIALEPVTRQAFFDAKASFEDVAAVAVTNGPGLMPALLVGVSFAKGLAASHRLPFIGINHFLAHIYAAFLDGGDAKLPDPKLYPLLALVVSGGHTALVLVTPDGKAKVIGTTIDDAAGEALDKASKLLGLGYPGGPVIEKTAAGGDPEKYHFPRPLTGTAGKALAAANKYNFSFSGIKTALLYHAQRLSEDHSGTLTGQIMTDTVASYQAAVVDVLVKKTLEAAREFHVGAIVISGGVACNSLLRQEMTRLTPSHIQLFLAQKKYCTDNAAMVGGLAWHHFRRGLLTPLETDAYARLPEISAVPFIHQGV